MARYNLGKIMPAIKGQWQNNTSYSKMDVVYHNGKSYIAISDTDTEPSDSNPAWVKTMEAPQYNAGRGINIDGNTISADVWAGSNYRDPYVYASIPTAGGSAREEVKLATEKDLENKQDTIVDGRGLTFDGNELNADVYVGDGRYDNYVYAIDRISPIPHRLVTADELNSNTLDITVQYADGTTEVVTIYKQR